MVVSNPKSTPAFEHSLICSNTSFADFIAARCGEKGDRPEAIRSALINRLHFAYSGKKVRANVVFPEPLGPAIIYTFLFFKIHFFQNQKYAFQFHIEFHNIASDE